MFIHIQSIFYKNKIERIDEFEFIPPQGKLRRHRNNQSKLDHLVALTACSEQSQIW